MADVDEGLRRGIIVSIALAFPGFTRMKVFPPKMSSRRLRESRRNETTPVSENDSDASVKVNGKTSTSKHEDSDSDIEIVDVPEDGDDETEETSQAGSETSSRKHKHDTAEMLHCTSCGKGIHPKFPARCFEHPDLKVLICKACLEYYESGDITKDEDGLDEQCRWCGEGGKLFGCDHCHNTFCKSCIKRNLGKDELLSVEAGDEWKCYICDNTNIQSLVDKCAELIKRKDCKQNGATPKFSETFKCTSCGKQINPNKTGSVARHPELKVLICKKCYKYYKSGEISQDSKGFDEQCRWCGDGGNLFGCDMCHNAFCKACVVRNLGREQIFAIKNPKGGKWKCYICRPSTIEDLKLQCTNLIRRIKGKDPKQENIAESIKPKEESEPEPEPESKPDKRKVSRRTDTLSKKKPSKKEIEIKDDNVGEKKIKDSNSMKNKPNQPKNPKFDKNTSDSSHSRKETVSESDDLSTILSLQEYVWNVDVTNIKRVVGDLQDLTSSLSKTLRKVEKQLERYNYEGSSNEDSVPPKKSLQTLKKVWFRYQKWTGKIVSGIDLDEEDDEKHKEDNHSKNGLEKEKDETEDESKAEKDENRPSKNKKTPDESMDEGDQSESKNDEKEDNNQQKNNKKSDNKNKTKKNAADTSVPCKPEKLGNKSYTELTDSSSVDETETMEDETDKECEGSANSKSCAPSDKENAAAKLELLKEMAEELSMESEGEMELVGDNAIMSFCKSENEESGDEKCAKNKKSDKTNSSREDELEDETKDEKNNGTKDEKKNEMEDETKDKMKDVSEDETSDKDEKTQISCDEESRTEDVTASDKGISDSGSADIENRSEKNVESDIDSLPKSDSDSVDSSDSSFEMESGQRKKRNRKHKDKDHKKSETEKSSTSRDKSKEKNKSKKDKSKEKERRSRRHQTEESDHDDEDLLSRSQRSKKAPEKDVKPKRSSSRNLKSEKNSSKSKNTDIDKKTEKQEKEKVHSDSSNYDSDLDAEIDKLAKMPKLRKSHRNKGDDDSESEEEVEDKRKKKGKKGSRSKKEKRKPDFCSTDEDENEDNNSDGGDEGDSEDEDKGESVEMEDSRKDVDDDNEQAKTALLGELDEMDSENSANEKDSGSDSDSDVVTPKKKKKKEKKKSENKQGSGSDSDVMAPKSKKWHSKLLDAKISDSDSDSDVLHTPKKRKEKRKRENSDSNDSNDSKKGDSDDQTSDSHSDSNSDSDSGSASDASKKKKKKGKKKDNDGRSKSKKRRRIKNLSSSSNDDGSDRDSGDDEDEPTTPGGHKKRKKIRKILATKKLRDETKAAVQAEEERRKRIEERQKQFNNLVQITDDSSPTKCPITTQLILEREKDSEEPLIEVHKTLIKKLKPHQVEAVQFMWDCCCENLSRMKEEDGGGCILAHCMGLGKTLSVISFVFTMMQHKELTKINKILVICPLNTVLNWQNEFLTWLEDIEMDDDFLVHELSSVKANWPRAQALQEWHKDGGIMIIGYEMFRNLTQGRHCKTKKLKKIFSDTLVDPGPDLVVCDEGHILKNDASAISKATNKIRTKRRIILTGTPLQNNLEEYHCMVDFVKPNLLGTRKEFSNRFVHPITNGQCSDSTAFDVKVMKRRAHILHEKLNGCVQRRDYSALTKYLPHKFEYVIAVRLSRKQIQLYRTYLDQCSTRGRSMGSGASLFSDYNILMRIWTHPWVLRLGEIRALLRAKDADDSEGSFIDDGGDTDSESMSGLSDSSSSDQALSLSDDSDEPKKKKKKKDKKENKEESTKDEVVKKWSTRSNRNGDGEAGPSNDVIAIEDEDKKITTEWWAEYIKEEDEGVIEYSGKLLLLFEILRMCEDIGDKILIFSQSLLSLDIIEDFLERIDAKYQEEKAEREKKKAERKKKKNKHDDGESDKEEPMNLLDETDFGKSWTKGLDYFRMDGSTSAQNRKRWQETFNDENNFRSRLFLISTRAGSLGINLVGANRVIIFDASWNPSHDVQSIFRVYRFGQTKPCYVYRFLAQGTMEEKIYERQVMKQSLSQRVVDEHQIERHFDSADLQELYSFAPDDLDDPDRKERPTPVLPKDNLLAELLKTKKEWIVGYHEHDSLLENKVDETLTEEERKAAWTDYEEEKKGVRLNVQQGKFNASFMQQDFNNMMNQMGGNPFGGMGGMMAGMGMGITPQLFQFMSPNDMVAIVREVNSKYPDLPPNMLQQKCQMVLRQVLQYRIMQKQEQEQRERLKLQAEQRRQQLEGHMLQQNAQRSLLRANLMMSQPPMASNPNPMFPPMPTTIDMTGSPTSPSASAALTAAAERKKKS
ncbi:hypothetical protein ScPMuIL_010229 [Solemya velum]